MATTKQASNEEEAMNELVTIKLPLTMEKQADVFVSLNGHNLLIQRGKEVQIPKWAAEILEQRANMEQLAIERQRNLPQN